MEQVLDIISWVLIGAGSVFVVIGAVGMVRMPDVYTRMHASSVIESLGAGPLIVGLMLQSGWDINTLKLLFVLLLILFMGPVVSHALAQAALHEGVEPQLKEDRRGRLRSDFESADEGGAS